jgi:hypothetical protein
VAGPLVPAQMEAGTKGSWPKARFLLVIPKKLYSFFNNNCNWDTADGKFQLTKWKMKGELHNLDSGKKKQVQW